MVYRFIGSRGSVRGDKSRIERFLRYALGKERDIRQLRFRFAMNHAGDDDIFGFPYK
jgi:hypothetical protein